MVRHLAWGTQEASRRADRRGYSLVLEKQSPRVGTVVLAPEAWPALASL